MATITVLLGDGSGNQQQVSDAQTAAILFSQGGEILNPNGTIVQPTEMAGAGTNPQGWLIDGLTLPDYFAPASTSPPPPPAGPSASTGVVTPISGVTPAGPVIYRLILPEPDGTFATGANYPGCSQTTSSYCDPKSFPSLQAAIQYAQVGKEIPVLVSSDTEAWNIVAGNAVPDPSQFLLNPSQLPTAPGPPQLPSSPAGLLLSSPLAIGALAVGGYLLLRPSRKREG